MTKLFVLAVLLSSIAASGAAAQAPVSNPMPDGSHDMYIGLGAVSQARYEGSAGRETSALPVIQFQWSNGVFVSGMSAGMHLSPDPRLEFGPLLTLQPGRDASGRGNTIDGIGSAGFGLRAEPDNMPPFVPAGFPENRLAGMPEIHSRLQAGAFLNLYLTPSLRLTGSAVYGAGNARDGGRLDLGVQRLAMQIGAQHQLILGAGATLVNRSHNEAFFGVTPEQSINSGNAMYAPGGGLRAVYLGARWNWTLSPAWMLTSRLQASSLQGDARRSPLVERPTNVTVSTAFAWRF